MFPDWKEVHRQLTIDLNQLSVAQADELTGIRQGFELALRSWYALQKQWLSAGSHETAEQILFFKEIKPMVTRWMDYFLFCYQGLLFVPCSREESIIFWKEELERGARFHRDHDRFVRYINEGCTHWDRHWFVRSFFCKPLQPRDRLFVDDHCRSTHDGLLRTLMAWNLYIPWVEQKLTLMT